MDRAITVGAGVVRERFDPFISESTSFTVDAHIKLMAHQCISE